MDKFKKVKIILIIIILLLVVATILLVFLAQKNRQTQNNEVEVDYYSDYMKQRAADGITADSAVAKEEKNISRYFAVKKIIDKFALNVSYLDADFDKLGLIVPNGKEQDAKAKYKKEGISTIKLLLAENYKNQYSINDSKIEGLKEFANKEYKITDMFVVEDSDYINTIFVYGVFGETQYNVVVVLDRYTDSFEIYLNDYFNSKKYSKSKTDTMKTLNIERIDRNEQNSFKYEEINEEALVEEYFNGFVESLDAGAEYAYNMLETAYKAKKFKGTEQLKQYWNNLKVPLKRTMESYEKFSENDADYYLCIDNYGKKYIIVTKAVMKYSVMLDTYTAVPDAYNKIYSDSSDSRKATICLSTFFEAINNKDYAFAYSLLNETFAKNNFANVEQFKNYVRKNWFEYVQYNYESGTLSGDNYSVKVELTNCLEDEVSIEKQIVEKNFFVKLGDNLQDAQISFGM